MVNANYSDHKRILEFYKMRVPRSKRQAKMNAEKIIAKKLCECIKGVTKQTRKKRMVVL